MRFVGNDQVKVRRREQLLILVVEQQRLHGGNHDFGFAPVVAALFVNDRLVIVGQHLGKRLVGLVFQLQPIDQKEHALDIARAQEQLDDRGRRQGLARARRHLEQKPILPILDRVLQRANRLLLIRTQQAQPIGVDEGGPLCFILPAGLGGIGRPLGQDDVVVTHDLVHESLWIGHRLLVAHHRRRRREAGDDIRIAALKVPEVVQVAVGQNHKSAVLGLGVFPGLLLPDERALALRLSLQNDKGKPFVVEQQEIDEAIGRCLEVLAKRIQRCLLQRDLGLKLDICLQRAIGKEPPSSRLKQLVDLDARGCFFACHRFPGAGRVPAG